LQSAARASRRVLKPAQELPSREFPGLAAGPDHAR